MRVYLERLPDDGGDVAVNPGERLVIERDDGCRLRAEVLDDGSIEIRSDGLRDRVLVAPVAVNVVRCEHGTTH